MAHVHRAVVLAHIRGEPTGRPFMLLDGQDGIGDFVHAVTREEVASHLTFAYGLIAPDVVSLSVVSFCDATRPPGQHRAAREHAVARKF